MSMLDSFSQIGKQKGEKFSELSGLRKQEAIWGYIFISPYLIGFVLFTLLPMIASFFFSLSKFQLSEGAGSIQFIGLQNWQRLFSDPVVWGSADSWGAMRVTFIFGLVSLPLGLIIALFLAVLLNMENLVGRNIFRTLFFMPSMIPGVASAFIWKAYMNPQTGWFNRIIEFLTPIKAVGASGGLQWLDDPKLLYIAYTLVGIWGTGNAMLLLLASLQGVPTDLYEASKVDGAGWWRRLWSITLPMISPVIFYNLILGTVGTLQYFLVPFALNGSNGNPNGFSMFYLLYLYKQAFAFANMGYGATLAWFLFIIALLLTMVLFWTSKYWVFYAGERRS